MGLLLSALELLNLVRCYLKCPRLGDTGNSNWCRKRAKLKQLYSLKDPYSWALQPNEVCEISDLQEKCVLEETALLRLTKGFTVKLVPPIGR